MLPLLGLNRRCSIGFLSVPTLRNSHSSNNKAPRRDVVSSPAKSERMSRSNPLKIRPRRLSQDSGIVAGRLVGYAVGFLTFHRLL